MSVHVCFSGMVYRRRILPCQGACFPQRRRVVMAVPWSPYYGPTFTCCHCGDAWGDGQLMERPFRPRWRQEASAEARRRWLEAKAGPVERDDQGYVFDGEYRGAA